MVADYSLSLSHTTEFFYALETFLLISAMQRSTLLISSHSLGDFKRDGGWVGAGGTDDDEAAGVGGGGGGSKGWGRGECSRIRGDEVGERELSTFKCSQIHPKL